MYTLDQSRPRGQVNCISPAVRCHWIRWPIFLYILWEKFISTYGYYLSLQNVTRRQLFYLRTLKLGIPFADDVFLIEYLIPHTYENTVCKYRPFCSGWCVLEEICFNGPVSQNLSEIQQLHLKTYVGTETSRWCFDITCTHISQKWYNIYSY